MKITCHSCSAKYTVSDDKVQGKTVKMKCRKCGATIVVGASSGSDPSADTVGLEQAAEGGEGPPPGSFLVNVGDNDQRTMTLAEVVEAYNSGVVTADTYVWAEGMTDWQALSDNGEIVGALNEAAATSGAAMSSSGYASAPPAAAAPAARKDQGRRSQDLFASPPDSYSGGASFGGAGLGASPAPAGKRDENSVLFSLNALTAATAPAPSKTTATKEDSGLIDLKALAAAAPAQAAPEVEAVGLFPLGAPVIAPVAPPQMNYAAPVAVAEKKKSPVPLIVGGLVAVLAIVGVFIMVKGGDPPKTDPTTKVAADPTVAQTATAAPTQTATAAPTQTATADATADASASATAGPVAIGPRPRNTGGAGGKPGATAKPTTGGGPATTGTSKPPPAKGNCGCPPGNLDCMLKCSVGKK
jgi:predicted Zn finger-like uncharacterized protein